MVIWLAKMKIFQASIPILGADNFNQYCSLVVEASSLNLCVCSIEVTIDEPYSTAVHLAGDPCWELDQGPSCRNWATVVRGNTVKIGN